MIQWVKPLRRIAIAVAAKPGYCLSAEPINSLAGLLLLGTKLCRESAWDLGLGHLGLDGAFCVNSVHFTLLV